MPRFANTQLAMIALILDEEEEQLVNRRRVWVHETWKKRSKEGEYATLYPHLCTDGIKFFEYFRMSENSFNFLFSKLEIYLTKKDTNWRQAITPRERLVVCLRYLVTGDSLKTISFSYRMGVSTVQKIVRDTCKIISTHLMPEMLPKPTTEKWKDIARNIYTLWNYPNCVGALDGKHVAIQAPNNSGSLYFNYKKTFSIVLLALVDGNYNFTVVNIGAYGKSSDGGIFANSNLGKSLERGTLSLPGNATLPGSSIETPHVIVGDEAFPLKKYLMRPFPGQNLDDSKRKYNYRLCRVRRIVENTFGLLIKRFRIYSRTIQAKPENVDFIIMSTCILHNFINKFERHSSTDRDTEESSNVLMNLRRQGGNSTANAIEIRNKFKDYFNSAVGNVSFT